MNKIVIGIDQSYQDTGVSVVMDGILKYAGHVAFPVSANNSEKRAFLRKRLKEIFSKVFKQAARYDASVVVILERIRLRSAGALNIDYIKSIGALNALICDLACRYDYPVYTVDTRAWKASVVGTAKPEENPYGIDPHKWPTIQWCCKKGYRDKIIDYGVSPRKKKGVVEEGGERYTYNDNIADSICIALYGFSKKPKLQKEH